uniref:Uncharacterized protein n=1 Tax=Oryza punctata TaxID=4537 RepID=A0A0E0KR12_ORYPU
MNKLTRDSNEEEAKNNAAFRKKKRWTHEVNTDRADVAVDIRVVLDEDEHINQNEHNLERTTRCQPPNPDCHLRDNSKLTANRRRKQDLPTEESPIRSSLNSFFCSRSKVSAGSRRKRIDAWTELERRLSRNKKVVTIWETTSQDQQPRFLTQLDDVSGEV